MILLLFVTRNQDLKEIFFGFTKTDPGALCQGPSHKLVEDQKKVFAGIPTSFFCSKLVEDQLKRSSPRCGVNNKEDTYITTNCVPMLLLGCAQTYVSCARKLNLCELGQTYAPPEPPSRVPCL